MKKALLILFVSFVSIGTFAQGKSNGKGHAKKHEKVSKSHDNDGRYDRDDRYDNDDRIDNNNGQYSKQKGKKAKYSKNVPTKVNQAFQRDYPYATNVSWTKSKGSWTATFGNNGYRSNATYHANGERRYGQSNYPTQAQTPVPVPTTPRFPW